MTSAKLEKIKTKFITMLPDKLAVIEQSWSDTKASGQLTGTEVSETLYRTVHTLAGSAGSFGYDAIGQSARLLEQCLKNHEPLGQITEDIIDDIEQYLEDIRHNIHQRCEDFSSAQYSFGPTRLSQSASGQTTRVIVLADPEKSSFEITEHLKIFGYQVSFINNQAEMEQSIQAHRPNVFVVEINQLEQFTAFIQSFDSDPVIAHIPVIFVSETDDWSSRMAAVKAGGKAFLTQAIDPNELLEQLDHLCDLKDQDPYRVVIVEDMKVLSEYYACVLEDAGMIVNVINDHEELLNELPTHKPELILMDIYLPNCKGTEIAQMLRQHPTYKNIPVVYLSTETALSKQLAALRVGGDDFLQKPVDPSHLTSAVEIRCQRFRELKRLINRDSLTGLLNHSQLKLELERELSLAKRRESIVTFVMLDIDHFKSINDQYGHFAGDQVIKALARLLKQSLRKTDIIARYGGEEFSIIMPDTDPGYASTVMEKIKEKFAGLQHFHKQGTFKASFSAGVCAATLKPHAQAVIESADQLLYQAKHEGRNKVIHEA